jgi:hypothetical protein
VGQLTSGRGDPKAKSRRSGGGKREAYAGGQLRETGASSSEDAARVARVKQRVAMMLTAEEKQMISWQVTVYPPV